MKTRIRIIPALLLKGESLVKTIQFEKFNYIGDPINTVRIFNELEVDELTILDITASREKVKPNFKLLETIANECFMPLSYGGGLKKFEDVQTLFSIGFEKVVINTANFDSPGLIEKISEVYGSQALIASIDYKKTLFGKAFVYSHDGTIKQAWTPKDVAVALEKRGAGEILLTSMDLDGTWKGFDLKTIKEVSEAVAIPVIASGGAGNLAHLGEAVKIGGASACAVGSMVVFQKKDMGVLVNFPDKKKLMEQFN